MVNGMIWVVEIMKLSGSVYKELVKMQPTRHLKNIGRLGSRRMILVKWFHMDWIPFEWVLLEYPWIALIGRVLLINWQDSGRILVKWWINQWQWILSPKQRSWRLQEYLSMGCRCWNVRCGRLARSSWSAKGEWGFYWSSKLIMFCFEKGNVLIPGK